MRDETEITVVVPAHNAAATLAACLDALLASSHEAFEIIVADDASTDGGAELSRARGVRVVRLESRSGPAAARNRGARAARGSILVFVDADVLVREDTLARISAQMNVHAEIAALFGSYDDAPAAESFVSQYKNLYHHFVHQESRAEAATFWAGCGAVRREAFARVGGFDERRYRQPSIEDIELGYRLRVAGCRILLDKDLQVKHLKRWTFMSLLNADIRDRAWPWSRLIFERGALINDLNLRTRERISAALVIVAVALLASAFVVPVMLVAASLALGVVVWLKRKMYAFFVRRRGVTFAAGAFILQLLYYLYSSAVFVLSWCVHVARRRQEAARADEARACR
jgi:GT2 family glycosyltransferase